MTKSTLKAFILLSSSIFFPANAFTAPTTVRIFSRSSSLAAQEESKDRDEALKRLGFSVDELQRRSKTEDFQPPSVRVNLIDSVDPVTLTAVGFALIAANFLIFANMGDGGIAGLVATVINLSQQ